MRQFLNLGLRIGLSFTILVSSTGFSYVVNQVKLDKNFAVLKSAAGEEPAVGNIIQIEKNGQPCSLRIYSVKGPWVAATPESCANLSDLSPGDSLTDNGSAPSMDSPSSDPQAPSTSSDPQQTPSNDPQYGGGDSNSTSSTDNSSNSNSNANSNDPQYGSGGGSNNNGAGGARGGKKGSRRGKKYESVDHHIGPLLYYSLASSPTFKYTATTTVSGSVVSTSDVEGKYTTGGAPGFGLRYMYLPMTDDPAEDGEFHVGFNLGYSYDLKRKIESTILTAPAASAGTTTHRDLYFQISNLEANFMGEISGLVFYVGPNFAAFSVSGSERDDDYNYLSAFGMQAGIGYMGPGFGIELGYRSLNGKIGSAVNETEIKTDSLNLSGLLLRATAFFSF